MLSKNAKITKLNGTQGAAATEFEGASVDMQGYEAVTFLTSLGTAATDNGIKAQQSSDDGSSDAFADLTDTQVLSDGTETDLVLEITKPVERYVRPVVVRGTSSTVEAVWAVQFPHTGLHPIDNDSPTAQAAETHASPAEGTA